MISCGGFHCSRADSGCEIFTRDIARYSPEILWDIHQGRQRKLWPIWPNRPFCHWWHLSRRSDKPSRQIHMNITINADQQRWKCLKSGRPALYWSLSVSVLTVMIIYHPDQCWLWWSVIRGFQSSLQSIHTTSPCSLSFCSILHWTTIIINHQLINIDDQKWTIDNWTLIIKHWTLNNLPHFFVDIYVKWNFVIGGSITDWWLSLIRNGRDRLWS